MKMKVSMIILFVIFIGCESQKAKFKEGKFKFYNEEGQKMIIERNSQYQLEYYIDSQSSDLFKIKWQGDSIYQLETVYKKDTLDYKNLIVKIDSTVNDTLYLTSSMKGIDIKVASKMIKINDNLSDRFKENLKNEPGQ